MELALGCSPQSFKLMFEGKKTQSVSFLFSYSGIKSSLDQQIEHAVVKQVFFVSRDS